MLFPVFEPRALPTTSITPSFIVITGLIPIIDPANAAAAEIRPPFFRYSSVLSSARRCKCFFASSNLAVISSKEQPLSLNSIAFNTSAFSAIAAFSESIIEI